MAKDRWPPVYNAEGLKNLISHLAGGAVSELFKGFYAASTNEGGPICQGDVLERRVGIPCIDASADPVTEGSSRFWLVVGNTCDFDRADAPWTQAVPIEELDLNDPSVKPELQDARAYKFSRHFFLPAWVDAPPNILFTAEFLRPVAIHKKGLRHFKVVARMTQSAWILLHSCLVRFLARDDGRFD